MGGAIAYILMYAGFIAFALILYFGLRAVKLI